MRDIKSLTLEELKNEIQQMGEASFRAKQMYQWTHQKLARGFEEMSNLPLSLRQKCAVNYDFTALRQVRMQ
ncbi:MAG: 23S rRNA (adenine(2503)-C(2))-methyltransferase RlmN, partial [Lachnospiraceae bacterium]|nr:23S rRNA (adenine(2503)-C(2))-methyltransferase RlmN [Lachnospiraceae bacterium]